MSHRAGPALALLCFCVPADAGRELAYKRAVNEAVERGGLWPGLLLRPLLWVGLALWTAELAAWVSVLALMPLQTAYPLMALSFAVTPLAAHLLLHERLTRRQWAGVTLITLGATLAGAIEL